MTNRISSSYTEGLSLGDVGYSNLIKGGYVSKDSHFGAVYSSIEWLQHGILKLIDTGSGYEVVRLLEDQDTKFLGWLYEALFGLSAFCYRKGNTDPIYGLVFPEEAYRYLTDRVSVFKKHEEELSGKTAESEFLAMSSSLNKLRLQCRDVERNFVGWVHEEEIIKECITHDFAKTNQDQEGISVINNILIQQRFLNRLSTYLYWLNRHYLNTQLSTNRREWISRMPEFNTFMEINHEP